MYVCIYIYIYGLALSLSALGLSRSLGSRARRRKTGLRVVLALLILLLSSSLLLLLSLLLFLLFVLLSLSLLYDYYINIIMLIIMFTIIRRVSCSPLRLRHQSRLAAATWVAGCATSSGWNMSVPYGQLSHKWHLEKWAQTLGALNFQWACRGLNNSRI